MFSGIVEATQPIIDVCKRENVVQIQIRRPENFNDLSVGDSVAVNGICLTIENFTSDWIQFAIGFETLKVTGWKVEDLENQLPCNLERSLALGDRIHGHLMSGHVEEVGQVSKVEDIGENRILTVQFPKQMAPYIWKKGGLCIHGVSLTVNECDKESLSVCLVPETLKRTNLSKVGMGQFVHLEADYFAKAMHHFWERQNEQHS